MKFSFMLETRPGRPRYQIAEDYHPDFQIFGLDSDRGRSRPFTRANAQNRDLRGEYRDVQGDYARLDRLCADVAIALSSIEPAAPVIATPPARSSAILQRDEHAVKALEHDIRHDRHDIGHDQRDLYRGGY